MNDEIQAGQNVIVTRKNIIGSVLHAGNNLRRFFMLIIFFVLIVLNIATLVSSAVYNALHSGLEMLAGAATLAEVFPNSPAEKKRALVKQNKDLQKHKARSMKVKSRADSLLSKAKNRLKRVTAANVGAMAGEAVPIYGIAIVVAATTYEITETCLAMKEMDQFMVDLNIEPNEEETKKVCGQKLPTKQDLFSSVQSTKDRYGDFKDGLGGFMHDFKEQSDSKWQKFQDGLGGTISEILN